MTHQPITEDRTRAAHEALDAVLVEVSELRTENGRLTAMFADCAARAESDAEIIRQLTADNTRLMDTIAAVFATLREAAPLLTPIHQPPPPPPPPLTGRQLDDPDMGMAARKRRRTETDQDLIDLP